MRRIFTFVLAAACSLCAMAQNTHNGHEYVDLGLESGTLWATCNVGATVPEGYGNYFAWGETTAKENYDWSNYKFTSDNGQTFTKYDTGNSCLASEDDAASVNWGGKWRMPTWDERNELRDQCTFVNDTVNSVPCVKCTGPNGQSILFPYDYYAGKYYWTNQTASSNAKEGYVYFFTKQGEFAINSFYRYNGYYVRGVLTKSDIPTAIAHATIESLRTEAGRVVCNEEFKIFTVTGIDVTRQNGQLEGIYIVKTATAAQKVVVTR